MKQLILLITFALYCSSSFAGVTAKKTTKRTATPLTEYKQSAVLLKKWEAPHTSTLWYNKPSTAINSSYTWMEWSLPIGNGRIGASLLGGVYKDELQFNEKSLWSGTSTIKENPNHGKYLNFGSLFVINEGKALDGFKDYRRWLDIEEGIGGVDFKDKNGNDYERRYFASEPDNVIVAHYSAPEGSTLSLCIMFDPGKAIHATTPAYKNKEGSFCGSTELLTCNAIFRVVPVGRGAKTFTNSKGVHVTGATEVLVLLAAKTDYDGKNTKTFSTGEDVEGLTAANEEVLTKAAVKGYESLLAAHKQNFRSYMGRVDLQFTTAEGNASSNMSTDALVDYYNASAENAESKQGLFLEKLYFDYGRYLEISSSRGSLDVPSNLQGLWNNMDNAPWNSDIHTNINVQMNYWPAEPTNLSECHLPFLNYIVNMTDCPAWKQAVKDAGQTVGWTVHTESNEFGGMSTWMSNYTIANAWYVSHLWQHYRYTLDKEYLKKVFPAMWGASQYWAERLVKADDGTYECPNEFSPEQGPSENATAHSQQLCREMFANTLDAIKALGNENELDASWLSKIKDRYEHLDLGLAKETYNGEWGTDRIANGTSILREWKYSGYIAGVNNHRHQSHLMCLYPFTQVYPGSEYFEEAVNSLRLRGDESTGWSMGWRINLWARALDGNHAHVMIHNALHHTPDGSTTTYDRLGGIYYNLYDAHPPFQIDGNFGVCAGIAELLLQSATGTLYLLPALPSVWQNGHITGLKAVGDFTVSMEWCNGELSKATIINNQGQPLKIKLSQSEKYTYTVNGNKVVPTKDEDGSITIPTSTSGDKIVIE